eukprot:TRINITY_DN67476_c0_g1_i2.p1 TRINITY_DN67476_c0_g1~~TRINITY_DN67476_c0_g1_i2.p1  ORF type:complete len:469 (-),score=62.58 TRINITY_DN67476_c0_g1_i2:144-1550(-)
MAEGRWRLGGLTGEAVLVAYSPSAMPQEIEGPWQIPANGTKDILLGEGVVRLTTTSMMGSAAAAGPLVLGEGAVSLASTSALGGLTAAASAMPPVTVSRPKHIVVEGLSVKGGLANGVYRRAQEVLNQRPVYHKADAQNAAALWFSGSDWVLGPVVGTDNAWAYAPSSALSPLAVDTMWRRSDGSGHEEGAALADAAQIIPGSLLVAGERYEQQFRLCDARPVYRREASLGPLASSEASDSSSASEVFVFFRAYEGEWCLGPTVGGVECFARSPGSLMKVVPDPGTMMWYPVAPAPHPSAPEGTHGATTMVEAEEELGFWERNSLFAALFLSCAGFCALLGALWVLVGGLGRGNASSSRQPSPQSPTPSSTVPPLGFERWPDDASSVSISSRAASSDSSSSRAKRRSAVACVVCFEAPRGVLLEPCRHVCCCKACAERLEQCPMCRVPKTSYTEVFLFRQHVRSIMPG